MHAAFNLAQTFQDLLLFFRTERKVIFSKIELPKFFVQCAYW